MKRRIVNANVVSALILTLMSFASGSNRSSRNDPTPARFEFSQIHMGTRFTILLYASDGGVATRAADAAFKCIAELDAIMSDYRETSELMRLCRGPAGRWVRVSEHLFRVLAKSQQVARRSNGAFDVTVGPVVRLWRRARRTGEMPDANSLAHARHLTGYDNLDLNVRARSVRLKKAGMSLDLGGIAKGYAADQAIAVLKRLGIGSALVAAGGDIVAGQPPPGSRGWRVAIAPESPDAPATDYLMLRNAAASTSGSKEQHIDIGGVRYSHIVNPKTGLGLTTSCSVTVVAPSGTLSDSLATAISVMGPRRGLRLVESTPGVSAFIRLTRAGGLRTFRSKGWSHLPKYSNP